MASTPSNTSWKQWGEAGFFFLNFSDVPDQLRCSETLDQDIEFFLGTVWWVNKRSESESVKENKGTLILLKSVLALLEIYWLIILLILSVFGFRTSLKTNFYNRLEVNILEDVESPISYWIMRQTSFFPNSIRSKYTLLIIKCANTYTIILNATKRTPSV